MTTRLKRKLADLGVDASSSKANESFCLIGTPLPSLEKSKDTGEFVPLWKQEVRDEKGRRRLHGAFTGGFSAGYFNTVGSKEGWAPSTFVSTRSDRAKKKQARPEDFMDEEDLAELAASRTLVDTSEAADILGGTQADLGGIDESDSMAAQLERALLPPAADSAGARILRKMGWRPGSGVGPRVSYTARRRQDAQFTPADAISADGADDEDAEAGRHMYARRDTTLLLPARKDNTHGLGYKPGMSLQENVGGKGGSAGGPQLAAGFGLGALNDADEDDLDVYESGVSRGKTRMAYDTLDHDDDERISMGDRRRAQGNGRDQTRLPQRVSESAFQNGQPVLHGFVVAARPVVEDQWFALPDIPKGWKPDPKRVWQLDKENAGSERATAPVSHRDWKKGVSADERGEKLGETPLPAAKRSVFDYMSQKTRERLQTAAANMHAPPSGTPHTSGPSSIPVPPHPAAAEPVTINIPTTERHLARSALSGFQPFAPDAAKHARYTTYLHSQATPESASPLHPLPGQTVAQFNHEAADFARAASVFRPLSAAMAGRFTSAAIVEQGPTAVEGLHTPSFVSAGTNADDAKQEGKEDKEEAKDEDPKAHAARLGMFGSMTREVKSWRPARLLCKRFGVREPEIESEEPPAAASTPFAPSSGTPPSEPAMEAGEPLAIEAAVSMEEKGKRPRDLSNIGLGDDEYQARDVLTYERPAMDVFKAIFASDDENSGDEGEDAATAPEAPEPEPDAPGLGGPLRETQPEECAPAHLSMQPSTATGYAAPAQTTSTPAKVDLASFRPTFVPRSGRDTKPAKAVSDRERSERSKKAKVTTISFADEEGDDSGLGAPAVPREKSKKRKDKEKDKKGRHKKRRREEGAEDEDIWVEKSPPQAVRELQQQAGAAASVPMDTAQHELVSDGREAGPTRPRKRASDFM